MIAVLVAEHVVSAVPVAGVFAQAAALLHGIVEEMIADTAVVLAVEQAQLKTGLAETQLLKHVHQPWSAQWSHPRQKGSGVRRYAKDESVR